MSGFSSQWLDLREPADACARDRALGDTLAQVLARALSPEQVLGVVDLGCGTGANLRWLSPRLGCRQRWLLLDNDPALLSELPRRLPAGAGSADTAAGVPSRSGAAVEIASQRLDMATGPLPLADAHLVTASALADLVSRDWLAALAGASAAARGGRGAAVMLALCYDGRVALDPHHRDDARVRDAVNRHQQRDKGFGPALGPAAPAAASALFTAFGFTVLQARSDWCLHGAHAALQRELLSGWHDAAREQVGDGRWLEDWLAWRIARVEARTSRTRVGHVDLLALPGSLKAGK